VVLIGLALALLLPSVAWAVGPTCAQAPNLVCAATEIRVTDPAYGAVGNGTTDNCAAWGLVDAAIPTNGARVIIPKGTYLSTCPLKLRQQSIYEGDGAGATVLQTPTTGTGFALMQVAVPRTCTGGTGDATTCDDTVGGGTRGPGCVCYTNADCQAATCAGGTVQRNTVVRGIKFIPRVAGSMGVDFALISEGAIQNAEATCTIALADTYGFSFSDGGGLVGGYSNTVSQSKIRQCKYGVRVMDRANDTRIINNVISTSNDIGIQVDNASHGVKVYGNTIQSQTTKGGSDGAQRTWWGPNYWEDDTDKLVIEAGATNTAISGASDYAGVGTDIINNGTGTTIDGIAAGTPDCSLAGGTMCKAGVAANLVYAGPPSGGAAAPTMRALVDGDVPDALTATNYLPLAGGTLSGTLVLSPDANEGLSGGGLTDCDNPTTSKLLWDVTTSKFGCGADQAGGGGGTVTSVDCLAGLTCAPGDPIVGAGTIAPDEAALEALLDLADLSGTLPDAKLASSYSGVGACTAGQYAHTLIDNAAPTCSQVTFTQLGGTASAAQVPLATTATALAANGGNCTAGSYPLGVDASGAVEGCTVAGGGGLTGTGTDDRVTRWNGTTALQDSTATLGDDGSLVLSGNPTTPKPLLSLTHPGAITGDTYQLVLFEGNHTAAAGATVRGISTRHANKLTFLGNPSAAGSVEIYTDDTHTWTSNNVNLDTGPHTAYGDARYFVADEAIYNVNDSAAFGSHAIMVANSTPVFLANGDGTGTVDHYTGMFMAPLTGATHLPSTWSIARQTGWWQRSLSGTGTIAEEVFADINLTKGTTRMSLLSADAGTTLRHAGSVILGATTAPAAKLDLTQATTTEPIARLSFNNTNFPAGAAETRNMVRFNDTFTTAPNGFSHQFNGWSFTPTITANNVGTFDLAATHAIELAPTATIGGSAFQFKGIHAGGTFTNSVAPLFGVIQLMHADLVSQSMTANIAPYSPTVFFADTSTRYNVASGAATTGGVQAFTDSSDLTNVLAGGTFTATNMVSFGSSPTVNETAGTMNVTTRKGFNVDDIVITGTPQVATNIGLDVAAFAVGTTQIGIRNAETTVNTPSAVQTIAAGGTILCDATVVQVQSTGDVITSTTTVIADGQNGQICTIVNVDSTATDTITIDGSGGNLRLAGAVDLTTFEQGDTLTVMFNSTVNDWVEVSRSNN
jgi:Periplasmic copper-binding protein (NosD)